jgi:phosphotransferase system enzyme I (PtsI)
VRTLDVGGEKIASALSGEFGGGANPALGLRAVRLSLEVPSLLEAQLSAILRAAARGAVRILLPMVTTADEVVRVREALLRVARRLKRRRVKLPPVLPPVGVMIEVPGAALAADALALVSDFFALGTNDLTMYTLAIDRGDERVAHLYNPLHPAVLRLIQFATQAALRAHIPVSICGEIAANPKLVPLLMGLGLRSFSMNASAVPRVKQRIRGVDIAACDQLARRVMAEIDPDRITVLVEEFAA